VNLAISSGQFGFQKGQARVFLSDWDSASNLARGDPAALFEPVNVVDDHIASVAISSPGEYQLLLTELTVRRFHDSEHFQVPWFAAHFGVTEADIQQGSATVSLDTPGVFRVSIFDRRTHLPLHGLRLRAHCDNATINFATDENGAILFLISPMQFGIDIDIEKATISVASL
jgi:hypothetical protein